MAEVQAFRRTVTVNSEHGLHIRPCTQLAQLSMTFQSRVRLSHGTRSADGKSILELMTLGATCGTPLELEVEGADAAEAIEHIAGLFEKNFSAPSVPAPAQPAPAAT